MTASTSKLVEPESSATRTQRLSRHKSRQRKRIALKVAFTMALIVGGSAIIQFAYGAFQIAYYCPGNQHDESGSVVQGQSSEAVMEECRATEPAVEVLMRWDAAAVLAATVLLVWTTAVSRKMKRHRI